MKVTSDVTEVEKNLSDDDSGIQKNNNA